jgi:hypothetical protein
MLYHDFLNNNGKLMHKWIHYFPVYEKHFSKFVNQSLIFWEIGVSKGGSLQMWRKYFGPFAKIIGIDIDPKCKSHEDNQIHICIGDQSDTIFLQSVIDKHGVPDVVLDDGSHQMKHIRETFDFLYPKVSKNGVYMVEDLHTAYMGSFGGGLKREGTFIEHCKDLIDSLNSRHHVHSSGGGQFANSTYSMSFYDSIVAFEKIEWSCDSVASIAKPEPEWFNIPQITPYNAEKLVETLNGKKILLFGSGEYGKIVKNCIEANDLTIVHWVDNDSSKQNQSIDGIEILSLEESLKISESIYLISVENKDTMLDIYYQLCKIGIAEHNIFHFYVY